MPVVTITGGTAGVGRATAREFADRGYDVAVIARGQTGLKATKDELESKGVRAYAVSADVSDYDALEAAADEIEDELGPIDVWVNDAMVTVYSMFQDVEPDEFRRVIDVTMLGSVWGTRIALERMRPRNHGTIVQVGSALAYRGIPIQSAYCTAKAGLKNMVESVRVELEHQNSDVRLCQVHLPGMNTPQFQWGRNKMPNKPQPMPPMYQPEVAADAIAHVAETGRREMWVGYATAQTVLGEKFSARIVEEYLARQGVQGQQTDIDYVRPDNDNLFEPVEGDFGAHGPFNKSAKSSSPYKDVSKNRGKVAVGVAALLAIGAGVAAKFWRN